MEEGWKTGFKKVVSREKTRPEEVKVPLGTGTVPSEYLRVPKDRNQGRARAEGLRYLSTQYQRVPKDGKSTFTR
ncbi:MAG: hypothetical protein EOM17_10975 [Synergistales bacterium]|nr:hypothetical protein [Synergistales bacterium]